MRIVGISRFRDVAPQMLWRGAALKQVDQFEETVADLAERVRVTARVAGSHRSKSIELPVVVLTTDAGEFTLRDNFHDVNLMAVLRSPSMLTLDQFFAGVQEPLTWEWYLSEVERARGYSWRGWSDDEMDDPRILRVRDKRAGIGAGAWLEKEPGEKARWVARMVDPKWYSRDWSSGELTWEGDFGPGVELFKQAYAYAEGIDVVTGNRKYLRGRSDFIIATNTLASAAVMIERLCSGL